MKNLLTLLTMLTVGVGIVLSQSTKKPATVSPSKTTKSAAATETTIEPAKKVTTPEPKIPEPEYIGVFTAYDLTSNKLVALERQILKVYTIGKSGLFSAKTTAFQGLVGVKSPNRFQQNQNIVFVVRAESNLVDPVNLIELRKLVVRNNIRVLSTSTLQFNVGLLGSKGGTSSTNAIRVENQINRFGDSSFKIIFNMEPGEYVFMSRQNENVFSFGVDPDPNEPMADLKLFAGRYVRQGSKKDYFELRPDGTLTLYQSGKKYEGSFQIQKSLITYVVNGVTSQSEINGNIIIDPDQMQWVRQSP